ncbi:MAG: hypothetical protein KDC55_06880 [Ignavibacteriae bacterium]|nr:hypothetical protein [Ignavibacteriota bacterium]MCB9222055.1 hypothetical protein [Ignavibacteria bacterium]
MNFLKKIIFITMLVAIASQIATALPNEKYMKKKENKVQRDPLGFLDYQKNTLSNIETVISNYGMIGHDKPNGIGSGYFPRGSRNQYIFGGGIWYAAQKKMPYFDSLTQRIEYNLNKLVSISYNPSSADSWQTPGRIEDGSLTQEDPEKYKVFFSTDYSRTSGKALDPNDADTPYWPIWDTNPDDTVGYSRYFGFYQHDPNDRRTSKYPKGPAMISGEDIFTTYHDLDINQYEGSLSERRLRGYPMGLQYEFTIYSWGFGRYQNFFFCLYDVINMSEDTLYDCWLAPIMDVDLARRPLLRAGASNDRVSYWYEDPEFNMAYQFTNGEFGEQGQGFGYLGFDFLESPTIIRPPLLDENGELQEQIICVDLGNGVELCDTTYVADETHPDYKFLRKDSAFYDNSNQLGLVTFKNWNSQEDKRDDVARYNYISEGVTDVDFGPGDKRFMMATGAFHMRPGDTSRTVVCIMIATPSKTGDADGTFEDRQGLKALDIFAQEVYDNNFRAPRPPDPANIKYYRALNNGITIAWDSTSELSFDREEAGLDFLGYRIERGRVADLDTFNVSQISPNAQYPRGAGPYGWKEVATYQLPLPFLTSSRVVKDPNLGTSAIDSIMIVGPTFDANGVIKDTSAIRVIRHGQGILFHPMANSFRVSNRYIPAIAGINPTAPWGELYKSIADNEFSTNEYNSYSAFPRYDRPKDIFDDYLVGEIHIDRAQVPYNPLFFDNFTFEVSKEYKEKVLDSVAIDGIAVRYITRTEIDPNDSTKTIEVETSVIDSVYFVRTGRTFKDGNTSRYILDGALPISDFRLAMNDSNRVKRALDSLYSYIQGGKVVFDFPDFESDSAIKHGVILPYMEEITNNRTFTDIGDDNRDGILSATSDFDNTEKLINNTPYFYRVLAYDKGDASQPTPVKINSGVPNVNQIETFPEAAEVGSKLKFEIIDMDSSKFNGLYDFEFFAIDEDRAKKLFLGDTLELEFDLEWNHFTTVLRETGVNSANPEVETNNYLRMASIRNLSKDSTLLYNQPIQFNPNGCFTSDEVVSALYENAVVIAGSRDAVTNSDGDTINTFGLWNNNDIIDFSGRFTSGDFTSQNHCNTRFFLPPAYGTLGYNFKFALLQHGGRYRGDKFEIIEGDADTKLRILENRTADIPEVGTLRSQIVDTVHAGLYLARGGNNQSQATQFISPVYGSFNNGPVDVTLEFVGKGTETVEFEWGNDNSGSTSDTQKSTFTFDYYDVKLVDNYSYRTTNVKSELNIERKVELEHLSIDPSHSGTITTSVPESPTTFVSFARKAYPSPINLPEMGLEVEDFIGKFNIATFAHVNADKFESSFSANKQAKSVARSTANPSFIDSIKTYSGLPQGRYYLSGTDGKGNRIDFLNVVNIAGAQFVFDNANIRRRWDGSEDGSLLRITKNVDDKLQLDAKDFKVGDKVRMTTNGGASGLPLPNAKLKVVLKDATPGGLTDDQMEGIRVVPNPYYITHQNEQTPYESKLYFTKVPPKSTINIYTASGSLVKTIYHDPIGADLDEGRVSVNVWDMIMKNGLRVQSQTLIAQIIAPNGAETIEKFSIVVGTFNVYDK